MNYISREISIGHLLMGGKQPIRLQSMTNTPTLDTRATVDQAIRMIKAGSEMVRITAQGRKEAAHLQVIKDQLKTLGYNVPLIADIHFSPEAAEIAARIVEKVRINPGNYVDRPDSAKVNYSDAEYEAELEKISKSLAPLLSICKEYGTAIRIGVNHGSLSQRIVDRYGDTPEGMVQSALEFTRICHMQGFHNLVLSMKSSNVRVMVSAYLMLAEKLMAEGLNYPLHLGVTEAGDGEDGRLKSVAGIGALLAHGIGDTIRVSLTEDPEFELPVASAIADRFHQVNEKGEIVRMIRPDLFVSRETDYCRETSACGNIGGKNPVAVLIRQDGQYFIADEESKVTPLFGMLFADEAMITERLPDVLSQLSTNPEMVIIAEAGADKLRTLDKALFQKGLKNPLILKSPVACDSLQELLLEISLNPGNLLIDEIGSGICIDASEVPLTDAIRIGFGLLQATRMRISKTEFIACPSCGRTLFNIQSTLQQVKARTGHLKGLKIGVMGCIVNGPGEMADADYGYVGAGNGKVNLYKGKVPVKRGVPESEAVEALVELITENGDWKGE
ncbi:MAG: (E)-4-hydroxy-3-methylbut-2-enyl-diphosphate synthase [Lentimicrobium sp.]|nr:(E)-4-hydroxy-3-methylbut-2-enyl-diphosphate synthase [Lentimicrobium sp.]